MRSDSDDKSQKILDNFPEHGPRGEAFYRCKIFETTHDCVVN